MSVFSVRCYHTFYYISARYLIWYCEMSNSWLYAIPIEMVISTLRSLIHRACSSVTTYLLLTKLCEYPLHVNVYHDLAASPRRRGITVASRLCLCFTTVTAQQSLRDNDSAYISNGVIVPVVSRLWLCIFNKTWLCILKQKWGNCRLAFVTAQ